MCVCIGDVNCSLALKISSLLGDGKARHRHSASSVPRAETERGAWLGRRAWRSEKTAGSHRGAAIEQGSETCTGVLFIIILSHKGSPWSVIQSLTLV